MDPANRPVIDGSIERVSSGLHPLYQAQLLKEGSLTRERIASDEALKAFLALAQEVARSLDDHHVGTEHMTLALFRGGNDPARSALDEAGVTEEIPLTPRALMIAGLTIREADRLGSDHVSGQHVLLAVIRESDCWEKLHSWGPSHLHTAAESIRSSLADIEAGLTAHLETPLESD